MTNKTWRVGVAGLGTVGGGLLQFLAERPGFAPAGDKAVVTAVSARNKSRPRTVDISGLAWFDDPVALAASPDVDLFVELIGGSDGPAKVAVETALKAGKPVVTANKALIAVHGAELLLHGHDHLAMTNWLGGPDGAGVPAIGVPSASAKPGMDHDPAGYNLYRIEGSPGAWRCEAVSRGMRDDGKIAEIKRSVLSGL